MNSDMGEGRRGSRRRVEGAARRALVAFVVAGVAVACGPAGGGGPAVSAPPPVTSAAPTTAAPVPTPTPTPTPSPTPSAAPTPTADQKAPSAAPAAPAATRPAPKPTTKAPTKAPTEPAAAECEIVSNAGNCYSAGQYCRKADVGRSTHAANGRIIHCRDDGGQPRWGY
ncbi:hypothetical protein [Streptomyces sp. NPDC048349]|uniref:hypothetical protein n=1 Tax=Streptomyces sp. NPDC048349 TaxID=3155486 RepID=UPI0034244627